MNSFQKYSIITGILGLISKLIVAYFVAKMIPGACSSESCASFNYFSGVKMTFLLLSPLVIADIILVLGRNIKNAFFLFGILSADILALVIFFTFYLYSL